MNLSRPIPRTDHVNKIHYVIEPICKMYNIVLLVTIFYDKFGLLIYNYIMDIFKMTKPTSINLKRRGNSNPNLKDSKDTLRMWKRVKESSRKKLENYKNVKIKDWWLFYDGFGLLFFENVPIKERQFVFHIHFFFMSWRDYILSTTRFMVRTLLHAIPKITHHRRNEEREKNMIV